MTRINALTLDQAPAAARSALQGVEKSLGFIPNAFATLAHSPEALGGYLALSQALNRNSLSPAEREVAALIASTAGHGLCPVLRSYRAAVLRSALAPSNRPPRHSQPAAPRPGGEQTAGYAESQLSTSSEPYSAFHSFNSL